MRTPCRARTRARTSLRWAGRYSGHRTSTSTLLGSSGPLGPRLPHQPGPPESSADRTAPLLGADPGRRELQRSRWVPRFTKHIRQKKYVDPRACDISVSVQTAEPSLLWSSLSADSYVVWNPKFFQGCSNCGTFAIETSCNLLPCPTVDFLHLACKPFKSFGATTRTWAFFPEENSCIKNPIWIWGRLEFAILSQKIVQIIQMSTWRCSRFLS